MKSKYIVLVQCPDRIGLVATISSLLAAEKQNIISMREFADRETQRFFSRVACEGDTMDINMVLRKFKESLGKECSIDIHPVNTDKKIVILVTKEFHCLQDILVKDYFNTLGAEVAAVIGNHENLAHFTERFSIPFHFISRKGKTKEKFEKEILKKLSEYQPDFIILAKFMQILSKNFVVHFPKRIINIHHSFLPAFIGANPYKQAFERGVKIIGATAHFVTEDLDNGPIIAQETKAVDHNYNSKKMRLAGSEIERSVLNKAMNLVFDNRVFVTGNKTVVFE